MRGRAIVVTAFSVYLVAVALIVFWPTHVDRGIDGPVRGWIGWLFDHGVTLVTYGRVEWAANVVLFLPLGVFLTLLGLRRWWLAALIGLASSIAIEAAQAALLAGRTGSARDVLANAIGTLIGILVVYLVARSMRLLQSSAPA